MYDGKGIFTWGPSTYYSGEWLNNKMHGQGLMKYNESEQYKGEFLDDKKHGFGIMITTEDSTSEICTGRWEYDVFIEKDCVFGFERMDEDVVGVVVVDNHNVTINSS